jgi:hypothetical protein
LSGIPEPGVGLLAIPAMALLAWQYKRRSSFLRGSD